MIGSRKRKLKARKCGVYRNGHLFEELDQVDAVQAFIRHAHSDLRQLWELYKKDGSLWAAFRPPVKETASHEDE